MKSLGPRVPAASAAWAGHTPGPSLLPGRGPRPRVLKTGKLQVVVVVVLLLNLINTVTGNPIRDRPADPQSPSDGTCQPGYYLSDENGVCLRCKDGVGYTDFVNKLNSCRTCSVCKEDKDEKSRCIATRNTECQCKQETFEDENSTEFCQKCSPKCTNEEEEKIPCTPNTNRKCVPKGPQKLGTNLGLPVSLGLLGLLVLIVVALALWKTGVWRQVLQRVKGAYPGHQQNSENVNTVGLSLLRGQTSSVGNDSHYSPSAEAPEETKVAENSPTGRQLLVPADGNDSVGALKLIFNQCSNIVPFKSWNNLMRQMGLTDNDIQMVRAVTQVPEDALYQMLMKWLNQTGRSASINSLLEALEAIGERYARDTIEDHAVKSGKFIYQKATAEPGLTTHILNIGTEETQTGESL